MATRTANETPAAVEAEKTAATDAKSAKFKPVTLKHRDGRETTATTPRELVSAKFDGFVAK
jgi:hypothetical protein